MRTTECTNCGANARVVRGSYDFAESGLKGVRLQAIELIDLMRLLAVAVIAKPYRLTGDEIRFLRKYLRMTGDEFARFLHVSRTHLSKWENNEDKVGPQSDRLVGVTKQILARDGYRCRFCGTRVIVKEAQKVFTAAFPKAARWGPRNKDCHCGLAILRASIDHLVPFQRGGRNELNDMVTTCNPCQFGRGHFLLDEVELEDPTKYPPVIDAWDGLTRLRAIRMSAAV